MIEQNVRGNQTSRRWEGRENVERFVQQIEKAHGPQQLKNLIESDIVRTFVHGDRILDAGIGTGRMSLPLLRSGLQLTGIDASSAMIERCATDPRAKPARLLVGEIADLPFASHAFDTVMSIDTFAYLGAWRTHLDELVRVTAIGGRIILNVGSGDHWDAVTARCGAPALQQTLQPSGVIRVAECKVYAEECGLTLKAIVPYGAIFGTLIPNGWLMHSHAYRSGALDRLVSWIGADPRLAAFAQFIEQRIVGQTAPIIGSALFVVFDRAPTRPSVNAREFGESIAENDERGAPVWRAELNAHLAYESNRSFIVSLLLAAGALRLPSSIRAELPTELLREIEQVERAVEIDATCVKVRTAWVGRAAEHLTFHGVDLSGVFADALERQLRLQRENGA